MISRNTRGAIGVIGGAHFDSRAFTMPPNTPATVPPLHTSPNRRGRGLLRLASQPDPEPQEEEEDLGGWGLSSLEETGPSKVEIGNSLGSRRVVHRGLTSAPSDAMHMGSEWRCADAATSVPGSRSSRQDGAMTARTGRTPRRDRYALGSVVQA